MHVGIHRCQGDPAQESDFVSDFQSLRGLKCDKSNQHAHVIGGIKITEPAGHYSSAIEKQFRSDHLTSTREVLASEGVAVQDPGGAVADDDDLVPSSDDDLLIDPDDDVPAENTKAGDKTSKSKIQIDPRVMRTVQKMHESTGHRSRRTLARVLRITGAPPGAIEAAKRLKCSTCDERKRPHSHRTATLLVARHFGDVLHMDLVDVHDANEEQHRFVNAVDVASCSQVVIYIPKKSSAEVIKALSASWFAWAGSPRLRFRRWSRVLQRGVRRLA